MARSGDTLTGELISIGLHTGNNEAIEAWAEAFTKYFEDAIANAFEITIGALRTTNMAAPNNPKDEMIAALAPLSTDGANALQSGVTAFWASIAAAPHVYFPGTTIITPPSTLSSVAADLESVAPANTSEAVSVEIAMNRVSNGHAPTDTTGLHNLNNGGTATFPGPTVAPIL